MRKIHTKLLAMLLSVLLVCSAVPFTAVSVSAAGDESGASGDCLWSFDAASSTLIISGSGAMADYYDSTFQPWFQKSGFVENLVIEPGVTHIGDSAFAYFGMLKSVSLPYSVQSIGGEAFKGSALTAVTIPSGVTSIGASAFEDCASLRDVVLCADLKSVGLKAFLNTALSSVYVPGKSTEIGYYAFGYDKNGNKISGFTVGGYSDSAAYTYSKNNCFDFSAVNTNSAYSVHVFEGRIYSLSRKMYVEKAQQGELLQIVETESPNVRIDSFVSDDAEIRAIDGGWYFTMPGRSVNIYIQGEYSRPLDIDFSHDGTVELDGNKYNAVKKALAGCMTVDLGSGIAEYDLDGSGSADVRISPYSAIRLDSASVTGSVAFSGEKGGISPVTFIFAENLISSGRLYLELPNAGDSYDWQSGSADITPDYNSHFTVRESHWFTEWGVAPESFEGGQKYFIEMVLEPDEGYAFSGGAYFTVYGADAVNGGSVQTAGLNSDGSLNVRTDEFYIPGEPHSVYVENGMAADSEGETSSFRKLTQARAGDKVWVNIGEDNIGDDEFVVQGTNQPYSDEVYFMGESGYYFIMPDEDVYVELSYETGKLMSGVIDLSGGAVYHADGGKNYAEYGKSQCYGIYMVLYEASEEHEYDDESNTNKFDVDGDGTFDVAKQGNDFFLLETSSLSSPTGELALRLDKGGSIYCPMRNLKIIFAEPSVQKHKITVNNGIALDRNGEPITEAYEGESVYLSYNPDKLAYDEYVVQFSMEAFSGDVNIIDDAAPFFKMPGRDVTASLTYKTAKQTNGVIDFRGAGSFTAPEYKTGEYAVSEDYGMYFMLSKCSASVDSDWADDGSFVFRFDVDGWGGYDIGYTEKTRTYTLLENNSLRPASGRITLELPKSEALTVPMRRLTILLAGSEQIPHKINLNGAVAHSRQDTDDFVITEEYHGQTVYLSVDPSAVPAGKYIVSKAFSSEDVEIDEFDSSFVMPEHDVTINVDFEFGDCLPFTLDLSQGEAKVDDYATRNSVNMALGVGCAITKNYFDADLNDWITDYDLDGDGRADIRMQSAEGKFILLNKELTGGAVLAAAPENRVYMQLYPVSVLFTRLKKGDVNGDGEVTVSDATDIQKYLVNLVAFDAAQLEAADVDGDGEITVNDATAIQKLLANLPV